MLSFVDKLWLEYPIPRELSVWEGDYALRQSIESLKDLIDSSVDEIGSDILLTAYLEATGMITYMPKGTVTVSSAMLSSSMPFQGNRLIKATYDSANNICYLRYYPAVISYKRRLSVDDLDSLVGDRLIYVKSYLLWKMAEKELSILKSSNMIVDNGQIDLSVLSDFRDKMFSRYNTLKEGILLYSTAF